METVARGLSPAAVTPLRGESCDREGLGFPCSRGTGTGLAGYLVRGSLGAGGVVEGAEASRVSLEAAAALRAGLRTILPM